MQLRFQSIEMVSSSTRSFGRLQVDNKELFRDRVTFASVGGIELHLKRLPELDGLMANYQHKDWWTRPHFDPDVRKLPDKTLSLLWQKKNRSYAHLLPVTDRIFRSDISGGGNVDGIVVCISAFQGGFARCDTLAFVIGYGVDPYQLGEHNVQFALDSCDSPAKPRLHKSYPEMLDYLGWCSWDAFYKQVDADGLLRKTDELSASGIPVRWIMIDDGWSEVSEDKRLRTFDAVKSKFPDGLSAVIHEIKQRSEVSWVGVWHTIAGYWGGIDPAGELYEACKPYLYRTNGDVWIPNPDAAIGFGFWNEWHSYLKRQGVDFVKVDSQSAIINFLKDLAPIGEAAKGAHTALEASVSLHFNGGIINCMGMSSENIWHRPMSAVSRNSDDFVPQEIDGFKEHAVQNTYNSFFHGHFYWGDWDMYWSQNHDAQQNMVLRAVSGGPVYVSDKAGGTYAEHIWPLIYRDGKIIRCDGPGQPTADVLTIDPVRHAVPLKLWNRNGSSAVVAAFNVDGDNREVEGTFGPLDVPGFEQACWVYEHFNKRLSFMQANERKQLKLESGGCELFVFAPAQADVTPIGLIGKLVSTDAILGCRHDDDKTIVRLKEGGIFAFASRRRPSSVMTNGTQTELRSDVDQSHLYTIDCSSEEYELTVEIDLKICPSYQKI